MSISPQAEGHQEQKECIADPSDSPAAAAPVIIAGIPIASADLSVTPSSIMDFIQQLAPKMEENTKAVARLEAALDGEKNEGKKREAVLRSLVAGLQSQVAGLQGEVAGWQSQMGGLQSQVVGLQGEVNTLECRVGDLENKLEVTNNVLNGERAKYKLLAQVAIKHNTRMEALTQHSVDQERQLIACQAKLADHEKLLDATQRHFTTERNLLHTRVTRLEQQNDLLYRSLEESLGIQD